MPCMDAENAGLLLALTTSSTSHESANIAQMRGIFTNVQNKQQPLLLVVEKGVCRT